MGFSRYRTWRVRGLRDLAANMQALNCPRRDLEILQAGEHCQQWVCFEVSVFDSSWFSTYSSVFGFGFFLCWQPFTGRTCSDEPRSSWSKVLACWNAAVAWDIAFHFSALGASNSASHTQSIPSFVASGFALHSLSASMYRCKDKFYMPTETSTTSTYRNHRGLHNYLCYLGGSLLLWLWLWYNGPKTYSY